MPRSAPLRREERRRQLLDAARAVFARDGYYSASIDDIIKEASVARGTFYNYFESKRVVFGEVLEELYDEMWGSIAPIHTGPGDDIRAQTASNIASICNVVESRRDVARILLSEAVGLDDEANSSLRTFYKRSLARLARALREGQRLGIVRDGNPDVLAIALLGLLKEYWFQQTLGAKLPPLVEFLVEVEGILASGILCAPKAVNVK